jgi:hypothetical protein
MGPPNGLAALRLDAATPCRVGDEVIVDGHAGQGRQQAGQRAIRHHGRHGQETGRRHPAKPPTREMRPRLLLSLAIAAAVAASFAPLVGVAGTKRRADTSAEWTSIRGRQTARTEPETADGPRIVRRPARPPMLADGRVQPRSASRRKGPVGGQRRSNARDQSSGAAIDNPSHEPPHQPQDQRGAVPAVGARRIRLPPGHHHQGGSAHSLHAFRRTPPVSHTLWFRVCGCARSEIDVHDRGRRSAHLA